MNDDDGCRIGLSVPSESRYMRLARLMASGVATSCGLPLEEVEDFRIAIDELCSALIELSDGDAVRLAFELADDALVVVGTTTAAPGGVLDDERLRLSRQILGVVTDDHSMRRCGDTVSFTARERLRGRGVG
jgi:hypothetical protein